MKENILTFQQIVDNRFVDGDLLLELNKINTKIINEINKLEGVYVKFKEPYEVDFIDNLQYRQNYFIKKTTRKITWNDIYKTINNIKAVPYKFSKLNFDNI